MKTVDDLTWEEQKALQRKLNLCAKHLNELTEMADKILGESGNIYMDASTCLYVMNGGSEDNLTPSQRQEHIVLESPHIRGRIGAGDW
ncbi:MAG: hypothetical protein AAGC76_09690 [Luteibacter sp.]|uniref:hypothetical protein n=1 Tax=Luteibacter sp. TaxID=1886636 RepID=UPI002807DA1C|nr:hypothetical protein [Luteibacter sp.]MDQ7996113.1 hypothetical protein [Luteibacter sp.]